MTVNRYELKHALENGETVMVVHDGHAYDGHIYIARRGQSKHPLYMADCQWCGDELGTDEGLRDYTEVLSLAVWQELVLEDVAFPTSIDPWDADDFIAPCHPLCAVEFLEDLSERKTP
jgi:hypothetical protein